MPSGNCLYAFSTIGQKIEWMRENPKVCLEVEEIDDQSHWTTVLVIGRYEEIHQEPERERGAPPCGAALPATA